MKISVFCILWLKTIAEEILGLTEEDIGFISRRQVLQYVFTRQYHIFKFLLVIIISICCYQFLLVIV